MEQNEILRSLSQDIAEIKKAILTPVLPNSVSPKWIPRREVMNFFDYAPTQMASLEQSGELIVTKIGKRKFILRESIAKLLDKNVLNDQIINSK